MRCAPRASNGPNHLGCSAFQSVARAGLSAGSTLASFGVRRCVLHFPLSALRSSFLVRRPVVPSSAVRRPVVHRSQRDDSPKPLARSPHVIFYNLKSVRSVLTAACGHKVRRRRRGRILHRHRLHRPARSLAADPRDPTPALRSAHRGGGARCRPAGLGG